MEIVRVVDFPDCKAKAMVIEDCNGDYNIYLNGRLSFIAQREGLLHEMEHIAMGHLHCADVQKAESEVRNADRGQKDSLREMASANL